MAWYCSRKTPDLLRVIISKLNGDWYCLNCLYSFRTKIKIEQHIKQCENKNFCKVIISSEKAKILEFSRHQKSDKTPFIIYADLESLIEKIDIFKNNPQKSYATQ